MSQNSNLPGDSISRRSFLMSSSSAAVTATLLSGGRFAHASAPGKLKVGIIGCGGRGTGAAQNCANASPDVEIYALGDLFPERLSKCRQTLAKLGAQANLADDRCFTGLEAYEKVLASGVDLVVLSAPPGFRPVHLKAAVDAGTHIFLEKPVCVDAPGYRKVVAVAEEATRKKLCIVAGTQRRHQNKYRETMKRIKDGAIGELVSAQCYWIGTPVHHRGEQTPGMSDIEFMCRNWYNWTWLCGDHIVEQHIHNIDVMHWAFGAPPVKCIGYGGRQARQEKGNIWDHFSVEFEFANSVRVASYCSHFDKMKGRVAEQVEGTRGKSSCAGKIWGESNWSYVGDDPNPYVQEHVDLVAAIMGKAPYVNEAKQVADSTLMAVMGRMAAYTGQEVTWQWITEQSKLDLAPPKIEFTSFQPHGIAIPGQTQLV